MKVDLGTVFALPIERSQAERSFLLTAICEYIDRLLNIELICIRTEVINKCIFLRMIWITFLVEFSVP